MLGGWRKVVDGGASRQRSPGGCTGHSLCSLGAIPSPSPGPRHCALDHRAGVGFQFTFCVPWKAPQPLTCAPGSRNTTGVMAAAASLSSRLLFSGKFLKPSEGGGPSSPPV